MRLWTMLNSHFWSVPCVSYNPNMLVQFVYYENISLFKQSSHLGCLFLWKMQIFFFFEDGKQNRKTRIYLR